MAKHITTRAALAAVPQKRAQVISTTAPSWASPILMGQSRNTFADRDRVSLIAAITDALADDRADIDSFPVIATRLSDGADITDTYRLSRALNDGSFQMSAQLLRRTYSDHVEYGGVSALIDLGGETLTPLTGALITPRRAEWGTVLPDKSVALIHSYEVRDTMGKLIGIWDGFGNPLSDGAIGRLIIVIKPSPSDPFRPASRVAAAGVDADLLYFHRRATASVLANDGMSSGLIKVLDEAATEEQIRELDMRLSSRNSDLGQKGKLVVVNYAVEYQEMATNTATAGWADIAAGASEAILSVFQMPQSRLARGGARTYENQATELSQYYRGSVLPTLSMLVNALSQVARRDGVRLSIGMNHPALNENQDSVAARAVSLYAAGLLSKDEARAEVGFDPVDGGDEFANAAPADVPVRAVDAVPFVRSAEERSVETDARRLSDALDAIIEPAEEALAEFAQKYHERIYRNVTGALRRRGLEGVEMRADDETPLTPVNVDTVFDVEKRNAELLSDLPVVLAAVAPSIADAVMSSTGALPPADASNLWAGVLMARIKRLVEGVDPSTGRKVFVGWNAAIHDSLRDALEAGYAAGEGMGAIAKRVGDVLNIDTTGTLRPGNRALRIARTEVIGLANQTVATLASASPTPLAKAWYSISDERTRESHTEAARQYGPATPIPLDQKFVVGSVQMDYPHDPAAPAREVVACRCRMLPIVVS